MRVLPPEMATAVPDVQHSGWQLDPGGVDIIKQAGFRIDSTEENMKTTKSHLIAALACLALSGGAFAQAGGGTAGGSGGGSGSSGGGTGMSAPQSGGPTATESNAQGADTLGNSGPSTTNKKMRHHKAAHANAASTE